MSKQFGTWAKRVIGTIILCFGILILIILNPSLLYAHKTEVGDFTVFHQQELPESIDQRLMEISNIVEES